MEWRDKERIDSYIKQRNKQLNEDVGQKENPEEVTTEDKAQEN